MPIEGSTTSFSASIFSLQHEGDLLTRVALLLFQSLQSFILLLRLDQDRQLSIRILPQQEEIFISLAALRHIALERCRPRKSQVRQRPERREDIPAAMLDDLLELLGRARSVVRLQIRLSAHP